MVFPLFFTLIIFLSYFLLLLLYFAGMLTMKEKGGKEPGQVPGVSVVIPFRNEASHLPGILSDLLAQDYPARLFSVLMVNDHSDDGSEKLVASMIEGRSGFSCMDLPGDKKGKKEAIGFALSMISTPWVLQTDADCRVGPRFISSHMHYLAAHPSDLIAGMVTTKEQQGGFLEAFERLDLLGLNGSGAGSFVLGRPIMCSGANLLYKLELYRDTRKFDPAGKIRSGDDMFLLIGARKLGRSMAFNSSRDSQVRTAPAGNMTDLIAQRIRWGAKTTHYGMMDIQFVAILVAVTNLLMLLSVLWIFLHADLWRWLIPGIVLKLLADFMILVAASHKTGQTKTLWWYIPVAVLYPFYMAIVIAGSFIGRPVWKGRKV